MTKGEATRVRILSTTMALINTKGYHATTLRDIVQATGVQKGNLYFHFAGKEALVVALVEWAWNEYIVYLLEKTGHGIYGKRLQRLIDAVVSFHRENGLMGGCLFGNLAMETAETVPAVAAAVSQVLDRGQRSVARWIEKAAEEGSLSPVASADTLALRLVAGLEGAVLMARLKKDIRILEACADGLKQDLLASARTLSM